MFGLFKPPVDKRHDRRLSARKPIALPASIVLPGGRTYACETVDISTSGARLSIKAGVLPERFEIAIPARGLRKAARLVWRDRTMIGVQYV